MNEEIKNMTITTEDNKCLLWYFIISIIITCIHLPKQPYLILVNHTV